MYTPVYSGGLPPFRPHLSSAFDPTYESLLSRALSTHHRAELPVLTLPPVQLIPFSGEMLLWRDFALFAQAVARPIRHIIAFLVSIWGVSVQVDISGLVLLSRETKAETLRLALEDYKEKYVKCKACKGVKTAFFRDTKLRRYQMKCEECLATRTLEELLKGESQGRKAEQRVLHSSS